MSTTASAIEWTDATWNPVVGCKMVSPGCANCYAETMSNRLAGMAAAEDVGAKPTRKDHYLKVIDPYKGRFNGKVELVPEALSDPLGWRKPRRVFVNSMSDLFHEGVPFDYVDRVFAVMALTPHHTYQILTKRPERMAEYAAADYLTGGTKGRAWRIMQAARAFAQGKGGKLMNEAAVIAYPLPNVWLGTSVEDQKRADERIPHLLRCPAAVRFLSVEPLLEQVDLKLKGEAARDWDGVSYEATSRRMLDFDARGKGIHWVIVGGESGHGARPCNVQWVRSIVRQCEAAAVPVFVKQLGAWAVNSNPAGVSLTGKTSVENYPRLKLADSKGGAMEEWPADLRVRQMPEVTPCA